MKIAIAQLNATVGDLVSNVERIVDFASRARAAGADAIVTPELAVCGYPPEDLLLREDSTGSDTASSSAILNPVPHPHPLPTARADLTEVCA